MSPLAVIVHLTAESPLGDSVVSKVVISFVTRSQLLMVPVNICFTLGGYWTLGSEQSSRSVSRHNSNDLSSRRTASISCRASLTPLTNVVMYIDSWAIEANSPMLLVNGSMTIPAVLKRRKTTEAT